MRSAQFILTQGKSEVFSITPISLDLTPMPSDSVSAIDRIDEILDGIQCEDFSGLLTRNMDLRNTPNVC